MLERVLVPLDGSKVGEAALPVTEKLLSRLSPEIEVEVTLLGVITHLRHWVVMGEASAPVPYTAEELRVIKQQVTDYLDKVGETLRSQGAIVITRVNSGNAADIRLNQPPRRWTIPPKRPSASTGVSSIPVPFWYHWQFWLFHTVSAGI